MGLHCSAVLSVASKHGVTRYKSVENVQFVLFRPHIFEIFMSRLGFVLATIDKFVEMPRVIRRC